MGATSATVRLEATIHPGTRPNGGLGRSAQTLHLADRAGVFSRQDSELVRLHRAIEGERLVPFFQPIEAVGSSSARKAGEVLVRMPDEHGELQKPASFLPAAEHFGLMPAIDRAVLRAVLRWLSTNPAASGEVDYLSINLSGQTLCDADCRDWIERAVASRPEHARQLCFEVTETALIHNLQPVRNFIQRMRRAGSRFALDDFGTGFCSLRYLHCLPVDFVKIDGAFVRDCDADPGVRTMLSAVNELCQRLGKRTIAEYVDRPELLPVLRQIGIDHAQGFAISEPFALAELLSRAVCAPGPLEALTA
jgi:EAL domain-containing protein (putative c-di-GMP-specific phosphodiesterase class I)